MVGASVLVGGVSSTFSKKTMQSFHHVVELDLPALTAVHNMLVEYEIARIELLQLTSIGISKESATKSKANIESQWKHFSENEKIYLTLLESAPEEEKKLYAEFKSQIRVTQELFAKAISLLEKNSDERSAERTEMTKLVTIDLHEQSTKLNELIDQLSLLQQKQIKQSTQYAFNAAQSGTTMSILVTIICALVGLAGSVLFATKLVKQIDHVISNIATSSREVAAASTQIAKSSETLSQSSTEQASSLSQTAASLEEITAMIGKASESANATENSSRASHEKAQQGREAVDQMLSSIEDISTSNAEIVNQVNHSNQQMTEIVKVIQEIGNKTKVINEIVFQTKLLSFNASVEAARAGEHGKGFAVVAEEVGNLAQMSGNAAKEISDMLDGSISKVESIVRESKEKVEALVENGKQKVEVGVSVARECSDVLDQIVNNVSQVSNLAQEISQASREQSQGVGEINKAMNQLDSVTQQNNATSEETSSAAAQLSAQAVSLNSAVDELALVVRGGISVKPEVKKSVKENKISTPVAAKKAEDKTQILASNKKRAKEEPKKSTNVVSFKAVAKKPKPEPLTSPQVQEQVETLDPASPVKLASGESLTPDRESGGFDE